MRINMLFVPIALLGIVGCSASDSDAIDSHDEASRRAKLSATLQADVDANHREGVVGVLAEVSDGTETIHARAGESQLGNGTPIPFDAKFRMGSNTKTFVAVVVLELAEEGKLSLDDSVERWLPGVVSENGNDGSQITIRQLLQHTSGLPNYTADLFSSFTASDYERVRFERSSPEQLVALALAHPPDFAPGTSWNYSNTNYVLAGMIIEQVTGRDWKREVAERILTPLELSDTFDPGDDPDLPAPHSLGYNLFAENEPLVDVTQYNHTWADAAGALVSTTTDLTHFWRALLSGKLLGSSMMAEMQATTPAVGLDEVIPEARYGLGIMSIPTRCGSYWSHFGDTFGFSTRNAVDAKGTRAVVVSNNTTFDVDPAEQVIRDDLKLLEDVMCSP